MRLHPLPCSLSRAGLLTEPTPAARRNVFMDPDHVEDMLAHAAASFSLQLQKQDRVSISANAMREMLDELMTGDVSVIDDTPVMRMPDGYMTREYGEWVAIVPALEGWVDCMQRITPGLSSGAIVDLGNLLRAGEEITPELVMVARIQLEDQIQAMKRMPIGAINAAVESTKSDWRKEEKLKEEMTMNARDKAPALPAIGGPINAAHGLLMTATDALSADQVAAMLKTTKKAATAQLRELQGLGLLESELRKGGTRYFRMVVVTEAKPGIPVVADDGCGACGDACASNDGNCRVKEESPPVCESVQAGGESQTGQSDDPVLHALGVMTRVASAARDLLHESEEFDFPDGLGRGAPQRLWDALGSEIEAAENDGAPIDDEMPPADPALLTSANRMLSDRLEGVAHALRGCGLPALAEVSGAEDLQVATAALSGAYRVAEANIQALEDYKIQSVREFEALGEAVVDYMPDLNGSSLIDGIRTMELLIDVQNAELIDLRKLLETERRVSGSAISSVAHICNHLGCDDHNGHIPVLRAIDAMREQITSLATDVTNTRRALNDALNEVDRMRTELAIERQALQEQINAAPAPAPKGYVLKTPKRAMRSFGKEAAAQSAAMVAARAGKTGEVFALVPVGKAVRGAEWKVA